MADDLLTVVEAAERLGITERALRRKLARPEHSALVVSFVRQTRTGTRTAAGIPPRLMALLLDGNEGGGNADNNTAEGGETRTLDGGLPVPVYQKLLAEKDAEIVYLREQLSLSQQNLARELTSRPLLVARSEPNTSIWRRLLMLFGQKQDVT